jgi:hypothetical protein
MLARMGLSERLMPVGGRLWNWSWVARVLPARVGAWLRFRARRHEYRFLSEAELRATRRSDTLFVFGSGWSINELSAAECGHFEEHDTLGFNFFAHARIVRVDYHLVREIAESDVRRRIWEPRIREYCDLIRDNPFYRDTILLVQCGLRAVNANRAIGHGWLPPEKPIFSWRTAYTRERLGRSFADGLSHATATIAECVNFAYVVGWRRIVLVGVDLYDSRYFWLDRDETRYPHLSGVESYREPHLTHGGVIRTLGAWHADLQREGIALEVYNPRSLLATVLPVYARPMASIRH